MNREYVELLLERNGELDERQEQLAALIIQHDEELNRLLETLPDLKRDLLAEALPSVGDAISARLTHEIPQLVDKRGEAIAADVQAKQEAAGAAIATRLESIRAEIVELAGEKFTAAEKQRVISFAEIEARLSSLADGSAAAAKELEAGLLLAIQTGLAAAIPPAALPVAAPALIDYYRGPLKEGTNAKRGELWTWIGTTYLALEDTTETPKRGNVGGKNAAWAVFAARGAGGGGAGGDSLPAQGGNSGKFLTTNGTVTSWAAAGGGTGLMLFAGTFFGTATLNDIFGYFKAPAAMSVARAQIFSQDAPTGAAVNITLVDGSGVSLGAVAVLADGVTKQETVFGSPLSLGAGDVVQFKFTLVGATTPGGYFTINLF